MGGLAMGEGEVIGGRASYYFAGRWRHDWWIADDGTIWTGYTGTRECKISGYLDLDLLPYGGAVMPKNLLDSDGTEKEYKQWAATVRLTCERENIKGFKFNAIRQLLAHANTVPAFKSLRKHWHLGTVAGWRVFADWLYENGGDEFADKITTIIDG